MTNPWSTLGLSRSGPVFKPMSDYGIWKRACWPMRPNKASEPSEIE
jgi:hypothetical protein